MREGAIARASAKALHQAGRQAASGPSRIPRPDYSSITSLRMLESVSTPSLVTRTPFSQRRPNSLV